MAFPFFVFEIVAGDRFLRGDLKPHFNSFRRTMLVIFASRKGFYKPNMGKHISKSNVEILLSENLHITACTF